MENYSYTPYPESDDFSPHSREINFKNTTAWEDPNQVPNYKVKFMCSYSDKIHPRPHDNQLAYIEDFVFQHFLACFFIRWIRFSTIFNKTLKIKQRILKQSKNFKVGYTVEKCTKREIY
ncbi:hypothetical protein P3S67_000177 [Capsicum chacoense]